jgi:hypothetical protein
MRLGSTRSSTDSPGNEWVWIRYRRCPDDGASLQHRDKRAISVVAGQADDTSGFDGREIELDPQLQGSIEGDHVACERAAGLHLREQPHRPRCGGVEGESACPRRAPPLVELANQPSDRWHVRCSANHRCSTASTHHTQARHVRTGTSYTRFTPSPSADSSTRMSRTKRFRPPGSTLAAWSVPHIARSRVMWRSTRQAPKHTAATVVGRPTSWPE